MTTYEYSFPSKVRKINQKKDPISTPPPVPNVSCPPFYRAAPWVSDQSPSSLCQVFPDNACLSGKHLHPTAWKAAH